MNDITIASFKGKWQARMAELTGFGHLSRSTLAQLATWVDIEEVETGGACTVAWMDESGNRCSIESPLELRDGRLEVGSTKLRVGDNPTTDLVGATVHLGVIVSFTASIGSGNTGTFAAEAQPVGDEDPRRWEDPE